MTPDERTLLTQFLEDLAAARGVGKDGEADAMIHQALAANPDAAYVLIQHAIVADQSLHAAQARIAELEEQVRNPAPAAAPSSFLPQSASPWGQRPPASTPPAYNAAAYNAPAYDPPYNPMPQDYEPMPSQQRPGLFSANSGLGSFLRNAGTTAAGVAGGEMLFSGISDLFGGHRGGGFGGGDGFAGRPEEVVVNNYNDDSDAGDDRSDW